MKKIQIWLESNYPSLQCILQAELDIHNTGLVNKITSLKSKLVLVTNKLTKLALKNPNLVGK